MSATPRRPRICRGLPYLAFAHELTHRPDGILDRHGRIDTVDVVEVDDVSFESLQIALAARLGVFRLAGRVWRAVGCMDSIFPSGADFVGKADRESRLGGLDNRNGGTIAPRVR